MQCEGSVLYASHTWACVKRWAKPSQATRASLCFRLEPEFCSPSPHSFFSCSISMPPTKCTFLETMCMPWTWWRGCDTRRCYVFVVSIILPILLSSSFWREIPGGVSDISVWIQSKRNELKGLPEMHWLVLSSHFRGSPSGCRDGNVSAVAVYRSKLFVEAVCPFKNNLNAVKVEVLLEYLQYRSIDGCRYFEVNINVSICLTT